MILKGDKIKTALVTGANRGIGLEICKQLGELGFHVFVSARNKEKGEKVLNKLRDAEIKADFVQMDVADETSIKNAAVEFGTLDLKLNVLINNAAILEVSGNITKMPTEELWNALNANSIGAFIVIREFLPFMAKGGRIVNVSSGTGALSDMSTYAPAYSISKTTLNAITKQFAVALKDKKIAVNSVCPGWVRTEMGGMNATRSVKKGAETIVWLATESPQNKTGLFWRDKKVIDW
ncbi:MAG: SDR family NAD(P)-dependent oxidoreductase [Ignavibacterium sp.]|nr:MAG: SDR family NAD(P)-dependent oxidoreductase [Ignavibacterium sp.]